MAIVSLVRGWAESWKPRPRIKRSDWCHKHIRLPPESSADDPRFNLNEYPFWREPLETCDDPVTRIIAVMGSTQVGKTLFLQALLASQAWLGPCPGMLATPDRDFTREQRDKIYRLLEETAALSGLIPPKHLRNDRWIDCGRMLVYLAWSGSAQRLSGKSCKLVLCTEVDRWQQDPSEGQTAKLVSERVKAFLRYLIVYEGTPTDGSSTIANLYEQSDRRKWQVPCPHCGRYQELRFWPHRKGEFAGRGGVEGLFDDKGRVLTVDELRREVFYRCENGCRIIDSDKPGMQARGIWVPAGQHVDAKGRLAGDRQQSAERAGFHLTTLMSPKRTFADVAIEWASCTGDTRKLQSFWNNWLGLKYVVQTKVPNWRDLGQRLAGGHRRGTIPAAALFLTCGVDVQEEALYWVVRAWGEASTSWLVDWGRISPRLDANAGPVAGSEFEQLDEIYHRSFPYAQPNVLGHTQARVSLFGIDVNYRSLDVHSWSMRHARQRIRCVAGVAGLADPYQMRVIERSARDGKTYPGGLERWALNVDAFKADIQGRWRTATDQPGAWVLTRDIVEQGEGYLRQIVNEAQMTGRDKHGKKTRVWQVVDQKTGNHHWDDEVYNRGVAEMWVHGNWEKIAERMAAPVRRRATQEPQEAPRDDGPPR